MAKLERALTSDFDTVLQAVEQGVLHGSVSATLEDQTDWRANGVRCAVRVFERYSVLGKNRVSLSVTLLDAGDGVRLSAITSGGSQAVFLKINTFGESAFLQTIEQSLAGL